VYHLLLPEARERIIRLGSNNVQKFGTHPMNDKELMAPTLLQICSKVQFLNAFWPSFSLPSYQKCILKLYEYKK